MFFWLDLAARNYVGTMSPQPQWTRPEPDAGLMQLMDEHEVSAMLWALDQEYGIAGGVFDALIAPRMTVPPFERNYLKRVWTDPSDPSNFTEQSSIPMVADLFDQLLCQNSLTASEMDAVLQPDTYYPFPSDIPLCR